MCCVCRRYKSCFGGQANVPKTAGGVALTDNDDLAVFVDFYGVLGEKGNTIVIAELTDSYEPA